MKGVVINKDSSGVKSERKSPSKTSPKTKA